MGSTGRPILYAISDATGDLAVSVGNAALRQFQDAGVQIVRKARVTTTDKIAKVIREARDTGGLVLFTLVSHEHRQFLLRSAAEAQVPAVDIMGPVLEQLTAYIHSTPSDQPGLKYQITAEYFRRNEAIEFAVKHDDGLGLETLGQADIILLGISRTSKTPLSIYLAYRGFKTANIPIVRGVSPPEEVRSVDPRKLVGLTIQPEKLVGLRGERLSKMGRTRSDHYADQGEIEQELTFAHRLFAEIGNIPRIDVTSKAIEEVASEVLTVLGK